MKNITKIRATFAASMLLSLISCGEAEDFLIKTFTEPLPPVEIDDELWSYVEEFAETAASYGVSPGLISDLRVLKYVDELPGNMVGVCTTYTGRNGSIAYTEIQIQRNMRGTCHLQPLMFHELGHCALQRGHESRVVGEVHPIMAPGLTTCRDYEDNWYEMLDDFFEKQGGL